MRKRELIKRLKNQFSINKKLLNDYDFEVFTGTKSYFVKVLNISNNYQITVNSKLVWNLKKGIVDGIRFKSTSSSLLQIKEFNKLENKIVFFSSKPYKILKAINESDLIDISDKNVVNDIFITSEINELIEYLKNNSN